MISRDQRLTRDIDDFSVLFGTTLSSVISLPLVIAYYTMRSYALLGMSAVTVVYVLFGFWVC